MKKVKILNSIGKNLAADVHYPEKPTDRLAILCPGYLDSKDYKHLVGLADALCKREGYTVVRFDPTGTWESEGDINDYTTTQYLNDVKSVIEYMSVRGKYKYILLGGHSRGGTTSILYAARHPEVSAVLAIMPSSSNVRADKNLEDWKKIGFNVHFRDMPDKDDKKEFHVPYSYALDKEQYKAINEVKKVEVPMVLIEGALDEVIAPGDVKRIFGNANDPKKYILIEGIGHDYRHNPAEVRIVNNKIIEALSEIN